MTSVLHLPSPIGGMAYALAQGEKALGLQSDVLYTGLNALDYPGDVDLHLERASSRIAKHLTLLQTFMSIRKKYDVFHFNSGSSLFQSRRFSALSYADLAFYPKEKKLFVTYNGCDARQKYPTMKRTSLSACHSPECYGGICISGERDAIKRRGIESMAKYVRHMWAVNPDLMHFLPKEKSSFLPYAVCSNFDCLAVPDFTKRRLNIAHAPTNRAAKGSDIVLQALERVKALKGDEIEIQLIEGLCHKEAMEVIRQADILVDQILVGWYGAVAIEAMGMGKPVVCRIAEEDLKFIPRRMAEDLTGAFINTNPSTVFETIMRCIEDRRFLELRSEAAVHYARSWHDPRYVASVTKQAYETL